MADIDYTIRSTVNPMCPNAFLGAEMPLEAGPTTIAIFGMQHVSNTVDAPDLRVGMAVLVQEEIMRLDAFSDTSITVSRGCADTIPQLHSNGSIIWFFDGWTGTDKVEYLSGTTIGIKALPITVGSKAVPVGGVPPNAIVFNHRMIRPYAPGLMECDGVAWYTPAALDLASTPLDFTWNHRDRVGQHDVLISHTEAATGPEAGTTYSARVYNLSDTMLREETGITLATWSYALLDAQADFGITAGTGPATIGGYITIESERDGFTSWSVYRTPITVSNEITPP